MKGTNSFWESKDNLEDRKNYKNDRSSLKNKGKKQIFQANVIKNKTNYNGFERLKVLRERDRVTFQFSKKLSSTRKSYWLLSQ